MILQYNYSEYLFDWNLEFLETLVSISKKLKSVYVWVLNIDLFFEKISLFIEKRKKTVGWSKIVFFTGTTFNKNSKKFGLKADDIIQIQVVALNKLHFSGDLNGIYHERKEY